MRPLTRALPLAAFALLLSAAGSTGCVDGPDEPLDDAAAVSWRTVKLYQAKMIGTHNSYSKYDAHGPDHKDSIKKQLGWGVRVLEIDVVNGDGLVSHWLLQPPTDRWCSYIEDCLKQVRDWSKDNPGHSPIVVYVEFSSLINLQPDYNSLYKVVRSAWARSGLNKFTMADAQKPVAKLGGKVALVVYRKKADWKSIASVTKAFDGKGYDAKNQIFLAGKNGGDSDYRDAGKAGISFVKGDRPRDLRNLPDPKTSTVFVAANVCEHHDCRGADQQTTVDTYNSSVVNGVLTNELDDAARWLGAAAKKWQPNMVRVPASPAPQPREACFYRTDHLKDPMVVRGQHCYRPQKGQMIAVDGLPRGANDELTSISLSPGVKVILYKNGGYNGRAPGNTEGNPADYRVVTQTTQELHTSHRFNDHTSSFVVIGI